MDVRACPQCAGLDLHGQRLGEGLVLGTEGMRTVCNECGYQGAPLLFRDPEDYRAFRVSQRGPPGAERSGKEAAARSRQEADEAAAEARQHPLPPALAREEPGLLDRLPIVPAIVFLLGAMSLVAGLFSLGLARVGTPAVPLTNGPLGLPLTLLGGGLMLMAARLWQRPRAEA